MSNPSTGITWIRLLWYAKAGGPDGACTSPPFKRLRTLQLNQRGPSQVGRGNTAIFDGHWRHLAALRNGRELRIDLHCTLDGSSKAEEPTPCSTPLWTLPSRGRLAALNGSLDNFCLYHVALSEDAIAELATGAAESEAEPWSCAGAANSNWISRAATATTR